MAGGQIAQRLDSSKPINYRWIASLKSCLCDLWELMEHMTTKGLTEDGNESCLLSGVMEWRITMVKEINIRQIWKW